MKARTLIHIAAIVSVVAYLVAAVLVLGDYGITWDEPQNFGVGHKYLHYYTTGHLSFEDNTPEIPGHPDFWPRPNRATHLWPFANMLSAVSCYVFFQRLHWLAPIPAHHLVIPVLTAGFLYLLFRFVRSHWGDAAGLIAVLALVTTPRFFGHGMNNIKDVPELVLFSATLICFAEWWLTQKVRYMYAAAVLWACALATKPDAMLIPILVLPWVAPRVVRGLVANTGVRARTLVHIMVSALIVVVLVWLCYPPVYPGQPDKAQFVFGTLEYIARIGTNPAVGWNLYAPSQIVYATPVMMLVLFLVGFVWSFWKIRADRLLPLLALWLIIPVGRHCLPGANHYDGLRHFLIFVVPFAIYVSLGVVWLAKAVAKHPKIKGGVATAVLGALVVVPNLYGLVTTHPYQTTFFNALVGGLGGAQERRLPYCNDYWLNSYRAAGAWLSDHAEQDAAYYGYPWVLSCPYNEVLRCNVTRPDLRPIGVNGVLEEMAPNTYVVVVPRLGWRKYDEILAAVAPLDVVFEVKRQGGTIVTIYYKP